jgi:3-oxoacyl-[acyl-carrier protein] reductase
MCLSGQVAVVTGASRGIGRAIARRLAQDGAAVAVNYLADDASAASIVNEIRELGRDAVAVKADVREPAGAEHLLRHVREALGPPRAIVNNVGEFRLGTVHETSPQLWQDVLASNLNSTYHVCRAALDGMRALGGGAIVNVGLSPTSVICGAPNLGAYAVAKTGIAVLTKTLAIEEAAHGIRVNCVSPGLVDNGHLPAAQERWMTARVPMGRLGRADEVAAAVSFLVSEEASYVSGAILEVAGAWDWQARSTDHDAMVQELFEQQHAST